jgi:hypothetical protein
MLQNVNYTEIILALTCYGFVRKDAAALAASDKVFAYARKRAQATK